ncbi:MAG: hypothetical protein AB9903_25615 [Vulcanimicrobiota bacterium]
MALYYDKTPIPNINAAIPMYRINTFKSPTRSTIPLLELLKNMQFMNQILQGLELNINSNMDLHLEYHVKPPIQRSQASQTDLMVISGQSSLAIEAKWTEHLGPTVESWLNKGCNPSVFYHWLGLLQKYSQNKLTSANLSNVINQMLHRAASACHVANTLNGAPKMAYLVFVASLVPRATSAQKVFNALSTLNNLLGKPQNFPFYLIEVEMSPTAHFNTIKPLPKNVAETGIAVTNALGNGPLFNFTQYKITII